MKLTEAFKTGNSKVVTMVGAGGKVTSMFKLAQEYSSIGKTVIVTVTTEIFESEGRRSEHLILSKDPNNLLEEVLNYIGVYKVLTVASGPTKKIKLKGIEPSTVDRLSEVEGVDLIVVKGDGAAQRSFKAPAEHEPVIPRSTDLLVPVVGVDAIGKPLTPENAHRPGVIARMAGVEMGSPITPPVVARILSHEEGGSKGAPPASRIVPLINKVESDDELRTALEVARLTLRFTEGRIDEVVVGHVRMENPVICVVDRYGMREYT